MGKHFNLIIMPSINTQKNISELVRPDLKLEAAAGRLSGMTVVHKEAFANVSTSPEPISVGAIAQLPVAASATALRVKIGNAADLASIGTWTVTTVPLDAETVTIGAKVYTFQETLTDVDGNVLLAPLADAAGVLTLTGAPLDTETVTIGSKVYTFQDTLTNVDGNVQIAPTSAAAGVLTLTGALADGETITIGSQVYTLQNNLLAGEGNVQIAPADSATGVLTLASNLADTETVTIGAKAYTFQDTLTNVDGNVHIAADVQATGLFTSLGPIADTETVTIGAKTYTFQDTLTNVDGNVKIAPTVAATGTLTATATPADGETVTIGTQVYTFQTALTNVFGNVAIAVSVEAAQTLTLAANIANTETVTIGAKAYTFQDTLTDVDGNVHIGATASDTIDNFIAAITGGAGGGTAYATSMTTNTDVTAAVGAGDTMVATALVAGTADNTTATTETAAQASWGAVTLLGGRDADSDTLDNLIAAINEAAGSGTLYAQFTTAHPDVVAVAGGGLTIDITADIAGLGGNDIVTTETAANSSWGAGTLTGGLYGVSDTLDNFIAGINGGAGSGTAYAAAMVTNTDVTAAAGAGETIDLTAITGGQAANLIALTDTTDNGSFSRTTLLGGEDSADGTLRNFANAINGGAGSGTAYAALMTTNADVTAVAGTGAAEGTMTVTAIAAGTSDNSTASTETGAGSSWGGATLSGGTDSPSDTLDNLIDAINKNLATENVAYSSGTFANTDVTAAAGAGDTMDVTAINSGTLENDIATTETITNGSWGAGTLAAGVDNASDTIDNLIAAINLAAGAGTTYAALTTLNTDVTAAAGAGDTMDVTAIVGGTVGNAIATTETATNTSWGGATLAAGTNSATGTIDNLIAAINLAAGAGTTYAAAMTANVALVEAFAGAGDTMVLLDIAGASVTTTDGTTGAAFGGATSVAGGAGVQKVTLVGLDETGAEVTETILANGAGSGSPSITTFMRLMDAFVSATGTYATVTASGQVADVVIENAAGGTDWAVIPVADYPTGSAMIGVHSVPLGKVAFINNLSATFGSNTAGFLQISTRAGILDTAAPYEAPQVVFQRKTQLLNGNIQGPDAPIGPIPALSDIIPLAHGAAAVDVNLSYEIILFDA
jgi:hypothetical protein